MLQVRLPLAVRMSALRPLARWSAFLLAGVLLPACSALYVSGAAGSVSTDVSSLDSPAFDGDVDDSDSAWSAGVGVSLSKYLSLEFNYADLGEISWEGIYAGAPISGMVEITGITVAAVAHLPLGERFELLAMGGVFAWEYDGFEIESGVRTPDEDAGVDTMYGAGIQARLIGSLSARLEYNHVELDVEDTDIVFFRLLYSF